MISLRVKKPLTLAVKLNFQRKNLSKITIVYGMIDSSEIMNRIKYGPVSITKYLFKY